MNQAYMDDFFERHVLSSIRGLDRKNVEAIIRFLGKQKCKFIDDLAENNLNIFVLDHNRFEKRFRELNKKYNNKYLRLVKDDRKLLEELFH